jgi:hypothetical protein
LNAPTYISSHSIRDLTGRKSPTEPTTDFLRRIRTHQLYKKFLSQQLHRALEFDDYVREEKLSDDTKERFLEQLFKQRRRLKPERKSRAVRILFHIS